MRGGKLFNNLKESVAKGERSEKSLEKYEGNLERLIKEYDYKKYDKKAPKIISVNYICKNPDLIIQVLNEEKKFSNATMKSYIDSVINVFINNEEKIKRKNEEEYDKWKNYSLKYSANVEERYMSSKSTEKEKNAFVPYSKILNMRDKVREEYKDNLKDSWYNHQSYLLLELITEIKPKRCELRKVFIINKGEDLTEYKGVKTHNKEKGIRRPTKKDKKITDYKVNLEKSNYLEKDSSGIYTLILHMFKTSKKYKEIKEELSKPLSDLITRSLEKYPRNVLFGEQYVLESNKEFGKINKNKEYIICPYESHDAYSKVFFRTFGKYFRKDFLKITKARDGVKLTPNIYRHIWLSDPRNIDFQNMSNRELETICNKLGTSVNTARKMYLKIDYVEKNGEDGYDENADEEVLEEIQKEKQD